MRPTSSSPITADASGADAGGPSASVLIVDDSVVARAVIARVLADSARFAVAGSVGTVAAALDFLARTSVDVILLDVAMPGIDGISGLPDLVAAGRGARIVVVSSSAGEGAATTIQALALGAADTLEKPEAGPLSRRFGEMLIERLDRLRDRSAPMSVAASIETSSGEATGSGDAFDIVAIGASTGGIHALDRLLRAIPQDFPLPILVTQHLPVSFTPFFAAQLAVTTGRPCEVAADRLRVRGGRTIVAPGDAHLRCVPLTDGGAGIRLADDRVASGCLPSVDPMFSSLADIYGPRLLAVVLSGMGRDGAEGAGRVRAAGGCVVVQDQSTSVVWGMPGAVAGLGFADAILPPDAIGRLIASRRRP